MPAGSPAAPRYDPDLDLVADRDYHSSVFSHCGYRPFWGTGYAYPGAYGGLIA